MAYQDKEKQRAYQREWLAKRRLEYFTGKVCIDCGTDQKLELDHIDPKTKVSHNIWSWTKVRRDEELKKCVPRCEECHKIKTKKNKEHGLAYSGSLSPKAILSDREVQKLREMYASGDYTYDDLAISFEIGRSTVGHIVTRKRYK